jgi:hypothetical protein
LFGVLVFWLSVCLVLVLNCSPHVCWAFAHPWSYRLTSSIITVFAAHFSLMAKFFCLIPIFAKYKMCLSLRDKEAMQLSASQSVCELVTDTSRPNTTIIERNDIIVPQLRCAYIIHIRTGELRRC